MPPGAPPMRFPPQMGGFQPQQNFMPPPSNCK